MPELCLQTFTIHAFSMKTFGMQAFGVLAFGVQALGIRPKGILLTDIGFKQRFISWLVDKIIHVMIRQNVCRPNVFRPNDVWPPPSFKDKKDDFVTKGKVHDITLKYSGTDVEKHFWRKFLRNLRRFTPIFAVIYAKKSLYDRPLTIWRWHGNNFSHWA